MWIGFRTDTRDRHAEDSQSTRLVTWSFDASNLTDLALLVKCRLLLIEEGESNWYRWLSREGAFLASWVAIRSSCESYLQIEPWCQSTDGQAICSAHWANRQFHYRYKFSSLSDPLLQHLSDIVLNQVRARFPKLLSSNKKATMNHACLPLLSFWYLAHKLISIVRRLLTIRWMISGSFACSHECQYLHDRLLSFELSTSQTLVPPLMDVPLRVWIFVRSDSRIMSRSAGDQIIELHGQ